MSHALRGQKCDRRPRESTRTSGDRPCGWRYPTPSQAGGQIRAAKFVPRHPPTNVLLLDVMDTLENAVSGPLPPARIVPLANTMRLAREGSPSTAVLAVEFVRGMRSHAQSDVSQRIARSSQRTPHRTLSPRRHRPDLSRQAPQSPSRARATQRSTRASLTPRA